MGLSKIISYIILILFFIFPIETFSLQKIKDSSQNNSVGFNVPDKLGSLLSTTYKDNNNNLRHIFIVIDAHDNIDAQFNIAGIINYIASTKKLHAIYLEGASGIVSPSMYFRLSEDRKINLSVSDILLKNRFITGSEYYGITTDSNVIFKGVENDVDYNKNMESLKHLKSIGQGDKTKLLIEQFNDIIRKGLPDNIQKADSLYTDVIVDSKTLAEFVLYLKEVYASRIDANPDQYVFLSKLRHLSKNSDLVNSKIIECLLKLENAAKQDDGLLLKISNAKKNIFLYAGQVKYIKEAYCLLDQNKDIFNQSVLSSIKEYVDNLESLSSIASSKETYIDILHSYKKLIMEYAGVSLEIFNARDSLLGLYKGSEINLTSRELDYFNVSGLSIEKDIELIINANPSCANTINNIINTNSILSINKARDLVIQFYSSVEKRNGSIVKNIIADLPYGKNAILIIGGYHKDEIANILSKLNFSVTVIAPNLKIENRNPDLIYADYIAGNLSSLQRMIYYSWSSAIVAPIISRSFEQFSSRKDAIPAISARQLAIMISSGLFIQSELIKQAPKEAIIDNISKVFRTQLKLNKELDVMFQQLKGDEKTPKWPKLIDYTPLAGNSGVFIKFKIGGNIIGLQILKENTVLPENERTVFEAISYGDKFQDYFTFNNEKYSIAISSVSQTDATERLNKLDNIPSAKWIATEPVMDISRIREFVEKAKKYPFELKMKKDVEHYKNNYQKNLPEIKQQLSVLEQNWKKYEIGFDKFTSVMTQIIQYLSLQKEPYTIPLNITGYEKPIFINLLSIGDLDKLGVSALSVPYDDRIEVYFPAEYFQNHQLDVFLQILKHELDELVFKIPHQVAVMLEPLLHSYGVKEIGKPSKRIVEDFNRRVEKAYQTNDLESLYKLSAYFKGIIMNEPDVITVIRFNNILSSDEKRYLEQLAQNITEEARFWGPLAELRIAELGGEIRGFKFMQKLGAGKFGIVYMAEKDSRLWAVKLLNIRRDNHIGRLSHLQEILNTTLVYDDIFKGDYGDFSKGENSFFAAPYFDMIDLRQALGKIPKDEAFLVNLALNIAREYTKIERADILYNDSKPENIIVDVSSGKARIIDFGCSLKFGVLPKSVDKITFGHTKPYVSPEVLKFNECLTSFINELDFLTSTPLNEIDYNFIDRLEWIIKQASPYAKDSQMHSELIYEKLPEIQSKLNGNEYASIDGIKADIEPDMIKYLYSMFDFRSDIFAFGKIMELDIFSGIKSPEIQRIIAKALEQSPSMRYQSFIELYSELEEYSRKFNSIALPEVRRPNITSQPALTETEQRFRDGLSGVVKKLMENNPKPTPFNAAKYYVSLQINALNYSDLKKNASIKNSLKLKGINSDSDWEQFKKKFIERLNNAQIYELPSDSYMFWVDDNFAVSHHDSSSQADNIYISKPFIGLLDYEGKANVTAYELTRALGFSHYEAEKLWLFSNKHRESYVNFKSFAYVIADLESNEILRSSEAFMATIFFLAPIIKNAIKEKTEPDYNIINKYLSDKKLPEAVIKEYDRLLRLLFSNEVPIFNWHIKSVDGFMNEVKYTPEDIRKLIRQLGSASLPVRMKAVDDIVYIGKPSMPFLLEGLAQTDDSIRNGSLYAISAIGEHSVDVIKAVSIALSDKSPQVRKTAFDTIIALANNTHIDFFKQLLNESQDDNSVLASLTILDKFDVKIDIETPFYITHPNADIRKIVSTIFKKQKVRRLTELGFSEMVWKYITKLSVDGHPEYEEADNKLRNLGEKAVPYLERAINLPDESIKRWAAFRLGELGIQSAVSPLLEISGKGFEKHQNYAKELLMKDIYQSLLVSILESGSSPYIEQAVKVLGAKKDKSAIPALKRLSLNIGDKYSVSARILALNTISEIDEDGYLLIFEQIVTALTEKEKTSFADRLLFINIINLITQKNDKRGLPILRVLLNQDTMIVKKTAVYALGEIGEHSDIETLKALSVFHSNLKISVDEALEKLGAKGNVLPAVGFFAGVAPIALDKDEAVRKGNLIGIEQVLGGTTYKYETVIINTAFGTYRLKVNVDADFENIGLKNPLNADFIADLIGKTLSKYPDKAMALNGKEIPLVLLTPSSELIKGSFSDGFIGISESVMGIDNRKSLEILFSALVLREIWRGSEIASVNPILLESVVFREIVEFTLSNFNTSEELNGFISDIKPVFAGGSFFIEVLKLVAQGKLSKSEIKILDKIYLNSNSVMLNNLSVELAKAKAEKQEYSNYGLDQILKQAGVLGQDINTLIGLTDSQLIKGDFRGINIISGVNKNEIHGVILEAYLQRIINSIISHIGAEKIYSLFAENLSQSETPAKAFAQIKEMRENISLARGIVFSEGKKGESEFISMLITEYVISKFSSYNYNITLNHPAFKNLESRLKSVFLKMDNGLYISLFNPVSETRGVIQGRIEYMENLFSAIKQARLDLGMLHKIDSNASLIKEEADRVKNIGLKELIEISS